MIIWTRDDCGQSYDDYKKFWKNPSIDQCYKQFTTVTYNCNKLTATANCCVKATMQPYLYTAWI